MNLQSERERVTVGAASDPLTAGLPCPVRPEQQGQLPEGLRALRKYLSAAQLPTKTGTLNLAQWSWAGWELRCANVHHGWEREGGPAEPDSCSSLCSIPWPPKPVPTARQGRHGGQLHTWPRPQDLARKGRGIVTTSHIMAVGGPGAEQDSKPSWAVGSSCKGQEGKPKPREEAQSCHIAELLKRSPVAQQL